MVAPTSRTVSFNFVPLKIERKYDIYMHLFIHSFIRDNRVRHSERMSHNFTADLLSLPVLLKKQAVRNKYNYRQQLKQYK